MATSLTPTARFQTEILILREAVAFLLAREIGITALPFPLSRFPEDMMERLNAVLPPSDRGRQTAIDCAQGLLDRVNEYRLHAGHRRR
jgi:hypothetical protein